MAHPNRIIRSRGPFATYFPRRSGEVQQQFRDTVDTATQRVDAKRADAADQRAQIDRSLDREQQQSTKLAARSLKAAARSLKAAEQASLNDENNRREAQYRSEGRPSYVDANHRIQPVDSDEQWAAKKAGKEGAARDELAIKAAERGTDAASKAIATVDSQFRLKSRTLSAAATAARRTAAQAKADHAPDAKAVEDEARKAQEAADEATFTELDWERNKAANLAKVDAEKARVSGAKDLVKEKKAGRLPGDFDTLAAPDPVAPRPDRPGTEDTANEGVLGQEPQNSKTLKNGLRKQEERMTPMTPVVPLTPENVAAMPIEQAHAALAAEVQRMNSTPQAVDATPAIARVQQKFAEADAMIQAAAVSGDPTKMQQANAAFIEARREEARVADVIAQHNEAVDARNAEIQNVQAAAQAIEARQTAERSAATDRIGARPGMADAAARVKALDAQFMQTRKGVTDPAALQAATEEYQTARAGILEEGQAKHGAIVQDFKGVEDYYQKRLKEITEKERTEPDDLASDDLVALQASEQMDVSDLAKKHGITEEQATGMREDVAKMSRTWDKRIGEKAEPSRVLSDGRIIVNPSLWVDPAAYEKAVKDSGATPEAQKQAMEIMPELRKDAATNLLNAVAKSEPLAELVNQLPGKTDEERAEALLKMRKDSPMLKATAARLNASAESIAGGIMSLIAMATGNQWATESMQRWSERAGAHEALAGTSGLSGWQDFLTKIPGGAESIIPALAGGAGAGALAARLGVTGAEALQGARMLGSATAAGLQSTGGTYAEAFDNYLRANGGDADAARTSAIGPSLVSGLITAAATYAGGAKGVESLFAQPAGRSMVKGALKKALEIGGVVLKEGGEEFLEEATDQLAQGILARASYEPNKPLSAILSETLEAGALGAVLGGGMGALSHFAKPTAEGQAVQATADLTASDSEIEGLARQSLPIPTPEVDAMAVRGRILRDIGQGRPIEDLQNDELQAIGLQRTQKGEIKPATGKDARPPAVSVENGKAIILQPALDELEQYLPQTRALIGMSEREARAKATPAETSKPTATSVQNVPRGTQETPVEQSADWSAVTDKGTRLTVPASEGMSAAEAELALGAQVPPGELLDVQSITAPTAAPKATTPKIPTKKRVMQAAQPMVLAAEKRGKAEGVKAATRAKLLSEAIDAEAAAFSDVRFVDTGPPMAYDPNDGALEVNLGLSMDTMMGGKSVKDARKWVTSVVDEEFRHRVAVDLEKNDSDFAAALKEAYDALPEEVREASRAAYHAQIDTPTKKHEFKDAFVARHEFFRQYWQNASFATTVEQALNSKGKLDAWRKIVAAFIRELRKLLKGANPQTKAILDRLIAQAEAKAAELKGKPAEKVTTSKVPETIAERAAALITSADQLGKLNLGTEEDARVYLVSSKGAVELLRRGGKPEVIAYVDTRGIGYGGSTYSRSKEYAAIFAWAKEGQKTMTDGFKVADFYTGKGSAPESQKPPTVDEAAHEAATSPKNDLPEPTEAQAAAGNYQKGHTTIGGVEISIENPAGSKRRPEWPTLKSHYGYILGTEGKDGDHLDVFIRPGTPTDYSGAVFVVNQMKADGTFDEHKIIVGAKSLKDAKAAYLENYSPNWKGMGEVTPLAWDKFKAWVKDGDHTKVLLPAGMSEKTAQKAQAIESTAAKVENPALAESLKKKAAAVRRKTEGATEVTQAQPPSSATPEPTVREETERKPGGNEAKPVHTFKNGDRVSYESGGKTLTGTVQGSVVNDEVTVNVDQILKAGGVPLRRIEFVPVGDLTLISEGEPKAPKPETKPAPTETLPPQSETKAPVPETKSTASESLKADVRAAFEGLFTAPPADTLASAPPAQDTQRSLPPDKLPAFIGLAQKIVGEGITTPQALGAMLDDVFPGGQARPYSQALWDALGMVNNELRGTHDWASVYSSLANKGKQPEDTPHTNEPASDIRGGSESESAVPPRTRTPGRKPKGKSDAQDVGADVPTDVEPSGNSGDSEGVSDGAQRPSVSDSESGAGSIRGKPSGGTKRTRADDAGSGEGVDQPSHTPARANYFLADPESVVGGGPKARFAKNKAAIETYETLTLENRDPTPEELDKLAAYTGWGSFGQELFNGSWEHPDPKSGWQEEDAWLRDNLGKEAWESAQASIINAHYTDPPTVLSMWDMLRRMGFDGGRVLEPSMGIGNFYSLMPRDLMVNSRLTGIEMDTMTGRIAKMLHPQANVQIKPYQESQTADNFYDLVIGNWPFAKDGPADRRFNHLGLSLHDYFFAKALAQTRPGGLVVGITSAGTMDKKSPVARKYLASQGELVAAFRLPTGAFEKYAGTKVVTDIIILRKRPTPIENLDGEEWIQSVKDPAGKDFFYNEYFVKRPENILGDITLGSGTTYGRAGMIVNRRDGFLEQLQNLALRLPEGTFKPWVAPTKQISYIANTSSVKRQNALVEHEGDLHLVEGEQLKPLQDVAKWKQKDEAKTQKRLDEARAIMGMRDDLDALMLAYKGGGDTEGARKKLRKSYDAFVKKYGSPRESRMLQILVNAGEPSAGSLLDLDELRDGKYLPRAILTKDIMRRPVVTAKGSIEDAYALHRNNTLHFDLGEIAKLAEVSVADVERRLVELGQIFKTPVGDWQARDVYLAGNVRQKLREAREAQQDGQDMARNIEELEKIQPPDTPYFDIEVKMGAAWIEKSDYVDFIASLLHAKPEDIELVKVPSGWNVRIEGPSTSSQEGRNVWGVPELHPSKIFGAAMNGTAVTVKAEDDDGKVYTDEKQTEVANGKVEAIREELAAWLWKDPVRTARLSLAYNEARNSTTTPKLDGSHLRLEGLALTLGDDEFAFRKHQQDAVWRGVLDQRGMFAHEVGTGKTFTIAGIAMEGRRLGVIRKPLIFGHNANHDSVAADFRKAYPAARVLHLDDLSPAKRDSALRQIALDEWDSIIVPHSLIDRFALKKETMMAIARKEIEAMENEIYAEAEELGVDLSDVNLDDEKAVALAIGKTAGGHTAKNLVKARNRIITRIEKKAQDNLREGAVFFEDLGIDAIFVDEAHIFKKIGLATRKNIKGLNKEESGPGFSLSLLTDYLKMQNGGKGVFLFTGTPVTNTLNEVYNMMRFVMDDTMNETGIRSFDDWFNNFADTTFDVELTSGGTYEAVERLLAFINVPELARLAGQHFDVVQAKNMPEFKPRDSAEGITENPVGRPAKSIIPVVADMSPEQIETKAAIEKRYREYKALSAKDKRLRQMTGKDVPILMESDGSKSAIDERMYRLSAPDFAGSKVNQMVGKVLGHFHEHDKSTQMIFMEKGYNDFTISQKKIRDANGFVVKDANNKSMTYKVRVDQFNLTRDIVKKLVAGGINPDEIAVFSDMRLDPESKYPGDPLRSVHKVTGRVSKEDLAKMMREGKIRVAIGSTQSMGTGVNAQDWMKAMHHLDAPWTPGEFEQRNGRGWRQGNKWNTVLEYRYFTEGSHDGKRWQTLLNKVRFIHRFIEMLIKGGGVQRVLEGEGADTSEGEGVADFESSFSSAAGDPRLLLQASLKKQVRKLETRRSNHARAIIQAQEGIDNANASIRRDTASLEAATKDLASFQAWREQPFSVEIGGKTFTERKDADEALKALPMNGSSEKRAVGKMGAFTIWQGPKGNSLWLTGEGRARDVADSMASIEGTLRNLTRMIDRETADIAKAQQSLMSLRELIGKPFGREEELRLKKEALARIELEIQASPVPAPSWLRHGIPQGSLVYLREDGGLKAYDVMAHRWDKNGYWVLVDKNNEMMPVRYDQALDEAGSRLLPDYEFKPPPNASSDKEGPSSIEGHFEDGRLIIDFIGEEFERSKNDARLLEVPRKARGLWRAREKTRAIIARMEAIGEGEHGYSYARLEALQKRLEVIERKLLKRDREGMMRLNTAPSRPHRPHVPVKFTLWQDMGAMDAQLQADALDEAWASFYTAQKSFGKTDAEIADAWREEMADPESPTVFQGVVEVKRARKGTDFTPMDVQRDAAPAEPNQGDDNLETATPGEDADAQAIESLQQYLDEDLPSDEDIAALQEFHDLEMPGEFVIGDYSRANIGETEDERSFYRVMQTYYRDTVLERERESEWRRLGKERAEQDPDGVHRALLEAYDRGDLLNKIDTIAAMHLYRKTRREAMLSGDPKKLRASTLVTLAYQGTRSELARAMAAGRDQTMTKEERFSLYLMDLLDAPQRIEDRVELESLPRASDKARTIDRLTRELEAAQARKDSAEVREKAKQRDAERRKETREDMALRIAQQQRDAIAKALKKEGLSIEDLLDGRVQYRLKFGRLVMDAMGKSDPVREKAIDLMVHGWATREIARATKMTDEQVASLREELRARPPALREALAKAIQKGADITSIAASLATAPPLATAATMTWEDALAEADRVLDKLIPTAQEADKSRWRKVRRVRPGDKSADATLERTIDALEKPKSKTTTPNAMRDLIRLHRSKKGVPDFVDKAVQLGADPELAEQAHDLIEKERARKVKPTTDVDLDVEFVPLDFSDKAQTVRVMRRADAVFRPKLDMLREFWINALLSGLQTHAVNAVGNSAVAAWEMTAERLIESLVGPIFGKKNNTQSLGEFKYLFRGILKNLLEGASLAWEAFSTEQDVFEQKYGLTEDEDEEKYGIKGAIPGGVGRVVRIPGRLLRAADAFFKTVIGRMEVGAHAYRLGRAQGLKKGALEKFIASEIGRPGSASWLSAIREAERRTFTDKNATTKWVEKKFFGSAQKRKQFETEALSAAKKGDMVAARESLKAARKEAMWGVMMSFIFPFVRTPLNIFRMAIKKSPLGSAWLLGNIASGVVHAVRQKKAAAFFNKFPAAALTKSLAEQSIAWTAYMVLNALAEGDDDDDDKKWLLVGGRPYSRSVGTGDADQARNKYGGTYMLIHRNRSGVIDTRVPFSRVEPFATALGGMIDAMTATKRYWRNRDKVGGDAAAAGMIAHSVASNLVSQAQDKTFLRGFQNVAEILMALPEPDHGMDSARKFLTDIAAGFVPNIGKQTVRNLDDHVRNYKQSKWSHSFWPDGSSANPLMNYFGREVMKSGGDTWLSKIGRLLYPYPDQIDPGAEAPTLKLIDAWNQTHPVNVKGDKDNEESRYFLPRADARHYDVPDMDKKRSMTLPEMREFDKLAGANFKRLQSGLTLNQARRGTYADLKATMDNLSSARSEAKASVASPAQPTTPTVPRRLPWKQMVDKMNRAPQ